MKNIKLSIVIPAYNEVQNLKNGVLDEVHNFLKAIDYPYEVLIVDDGSKDETVEFIQKQIKDKKNFKLLQSEHGGKAVTVMTGMLSAQGEVAIFTDMDQATPISEIEKLLPSFESFDIVIGSRHGRKGAPLLRKISAWGFATLRNIVLGLPFKDTQCGFKAFNKKSRKAVFTKLLGDWKNMRAKGAAVNAGFDVEALFLAKKLGFNIAEVDVNWHYVGTERVQLINDSIEAIKDMLRIRWNDLNGKYS